jgi:hypothetical protein
MASTAPPPVPDMQQALRAFVVARAGRAGRAAAVPSPAPTCASPAPGR